MARKICAFSKKIKEGDESYEVISDQEQIKRIEQVISELEGLPKAQEIDIGDLRMAQVQKEWIRLLLDTNRRSRKNDMNLILNDFTNEMQTRMREVGKYAISLSITNKLVLCHSSFAGETITPQWKAIPRMLDTGNVMRYVCFVGGHKNIKARYWEREASQSFMRWLGLPRKMGYLAGGNCRIQVKIEDIVTEFQIDESEIEQFLESHPELMTGVIDLQAPKRMSIDQILFGQKPYSSMGDFMQAYEAQKMDIPFYQDIYKKLTTNSVFWIRYYDGKYNVIRTEAGQENVEISKPVPGDMIFANGNTIHFDHKYLTDLTNRICNEEPLRIVHLGLEYKSPPFRFKNLEIYNSIRVENLTQLIGDYFTQTNLQDRILNLIIQFTILELLATNNSGSPICYLFSKLAEEMIKLVSLNGNLTKTEDVIEFKTSEYFSGKDEQIIDKLMTDLEKKFKHGTFKIYLIGVEDSGILNPILSNRLKSDRINSIERSLQYKLGLKNLHMFPVICDTHGILILTALKS